MIRNLWKALACLVSLVAFAWAEGGKPNIIFILADDLGYSDVGFQGSDFYETPHLDRLAAQSLRFTDAYAPSPLCSPTRASVLTGMSPARIGITRAIIGPFHDQQHGEERFGALEDQLVEPQIRDRLPEELITLPERLRQAGYHTAMMGKWHLGPEETTPEDHGFDVTIGGGHQPGPPSYFSPYQLEEEGLEDGPDGEYISYRLGEEAADWILEQGEQPYFLYLATYGVHYPFEAPADLVEYFEAKEPGKNHTNAIYAAMIKALDTSIGTVLGAVEASGQADNTVIIFTSDNGGLLRLNAAKGSKHKDLPHRNMERSEFITRNVPFSGGKSSVQEGGVRVPLIVRWPQTIEAGAVSETPVILYDFYPTLLEIAGLPAESEQAVDGESIVSLLQGGDALNREQPIVVHFPHSGNSPKSTIREGDWKYVHYYGLSSDTLYNLKEDPAEKRNRVNDYPELASSLCDKLLSNLEAQHAMMPLPNKNYVEGLKREDLRTVKEVQGWRSGTDVADLLEAEETGALTIAVFGRDPNLISPPFSEALKGPIRFTIRARYKAPGRAEVYWKPKGGAFNGDDRVLFTTHNNGEWQDYTVLLPTEGPVNRLRFDPCGGSGIVDIQSIHLESDAGQSLEWEFSGDSAL